MAAISSVGIGSGLDVNTIVTKLVELEKAPLTTLTKKAANLGAQMSEYGTIKSQIAALSDAATGIGTAALWNPLSVTSSSTAITASSTGVPAQASYSMEVQQLSRNQSAASAAVPNGTNMGTGTLTLQLGTWSSNFGAFTPGTAAAVSITIGTGEDTLTQIASKINEANSGVTATIVRDGSGERLSLRSKDSGEAAGFRLQVTDGDTINNDNAGLSRLGFDPAAGAFGMATTISTAQQARDAAATFNGVPVTSKTNTFTDLVPGLTLTAAQVTTSPVEIKVSQDTAALKKAITTFVDAYNTLNKTLSDNVKYDSNSNSAGLLQGDSVTVGLQNALRSLVGSSTSGAAYSRLSDVGITVQRDGSLAVGSKLDTALADPTKLKDFFTIDNSNPATDGFGLKLKKFTSGLLATGGTISAKTSALQKAVDNNLVAQQKVTDHATTVEARLRKQYSALDGKMASLNALSTYINQQVTTWNKNTG